MSSVTVEVRPAPQAAPQPRVVTSPWGTEYRINNGTIEARPYPNMGWHESGIYQLPASTLAADEAALLADLKAYPTEQPPAGEDTVVVTMPRSVAEAVRDDLGTTASGEVDLAYDVYDKLSDLLTPELK